MQGWQPITSSVRRPQPFRIVLFRIQLLPTDNTKHLFNLSIYRTVSDKKYLIKLFIQYGYEYLSIKSHF